MPSPKALTVFCIAAFLSSLTVQADEPDRSNDLVKLGTSLIDAVGEVKIARLKLAKLSALHKAAEAAVSSADIEIAKINVETAERKLALLKEILAIETEATKDTVVYLQQLALKGVVGHRQDQLIRSEARLRILQTILPKTVD
jgi:hypothetical protein